MAAFPPTSRPDGCHIPRSGKAVVPGNGSSAAGVGSGAVPGVTTRTTVAPPPETGRPLAVTAADAVAAVGCGGCLSTLTPLHAASAVTPHNSTASGRTLPGGLHFQATAPRYGPNG